jgi:nitronate monooxygenase
VTESPQARSLAFARRWGLQLPVVMAPMAGASPPALAAAVAHAGGMGALGALLLEPAAITAWVSEVRRLSDGPLQVNLWVPDPPPVRDARHEAALRQFLAGFGPQVAAEAGDACPQDFDAQCAAVLAARPAVVSTIMGLLPGAWVQRFHEAGVAWWATVTTPSEARLAEGAGADVIVCQGAEAGGHRGCFEAARGRDDAVGLFALLPQVVDAVRLPVVATGGIGDARGVAAALMLGASAVQVGTALLASPEAGIAPVWAQALPELAPTRTQLTRAFSGRWGRAIGNAYVRAAAAAEAPEPAPYPVQRGLTAAMRREAEEAGDLQRLQAWAGQAAGLCQLGEPAGDWVQRNWREARALLAG